MEDSNLTREHSVQYSRRENGGNVHDYRECKFPLRFSILQTDQIRSDGFIDDVIFFEMCYNWTSFVVAGMYSWFMWIVRTEFYAKIEWEGLNKKTEEIEEEIKIRKKKIK